MKMKKQGKIEFTKRERVIPRLMYLIALSTRLLVSISSPMQLNSGNLTQMDLADQASERSPSISRNRDKWLSTQPFVRLLENHEGFLPEFVRWRQLFADHAAEMAQLLMTFDGSEELSEDSLCALFANGKTKRKFPQPIDIFKPWTNRWSGIWSNGVPQYHTWDSTRAVDGRWIQPVSLSETRFVDDCCVEEMVQRGESDVAINVVSYELEITGWVSKRQGVQLELPHIGYLVNDTTLVWICQIKTADSLFDPDNRWFVFLETVDTSVSPVEYEIYGLPIEIANAICVDSSQQGKHCAIYYSAGLSAAPHQLSEQTAI